MKPAKRYDVPGLPRWVASFTLASRPGQAPRTCELHVNVRMSAWRLRLWLAWRLLTAKWRNQHPEKA